MANNLFLENNQANEAVSKFKLLSAYGGPGSIIHTPYGSIIISCIEEWGFLNKIISIQKEANETKARNKEKEIREYVIEQARMAKSGNIVVSNDSRLREALKDRKGLAELKYLVLIPDIEINDFTNKIKGNKNDIAISSTYMPKVFSNKQKLYRTYNEWYNEWKDKYKDDDKYGNNFFPPKCTKDKKFIDLLIQDNIVLICEHGHISDFPWSKFLRWRTSDPMAILSDTQIALFNLQPCCGTDDRPTSMIRISSSTANASGFDGKWIKCDNCKKQASLRGLMGLKITCPGHKPWEAQTGLAQYYSGDQQARNQMPRFETCLSTKPMKVALTTGNNLYFSRIISSVYMPDELFLDPNNLEIKELKIKLEEAKEANEFETAIQIVAKIKELEISVKNSKTNSENTDDSEKEIFYRYDEFNALAHRTEQEINIEILNNNLKVKDVTSNLEANIKRYFSRVLRIDNMKITSAQLDFSRTQPADSDSINILSQNIFRSNPQNVEAYPVVENYGEGIFLAFNSELLESYSESENLINILNVNLQRLASNSNDFSSLAIDYAVVNNWQLYLIHTFTHLIMRELEYRCGYPTASLSERLYVSNDIKHKMYGSMIFTTEGAEGSMGGVIAQTNAKNLNNLILCALRRATICNSDPLCWESMGQGLFELNFASCFSCSLISETSCEFRNIYLDRRILVDQKKGFFKDLINM